eukprot:9246030-Pyramimonas_sp.AAC.1
MHFLQGGSGAGQGAPGGIGPGAFERWRRATEPREEAWNGGRTVRRTTRSRAPKTGGRRRRPFARATGL